MTSTRFDFQTKLGKQLWNALPRFYREQDGTGDLAFTLDAFGGVLDSVHALLQQRLRDTTPEQCQDWLVPYFAELFHERLVSPDVRSQRSEVAQAILWRKQKGTIRSLESLAEAILQSEVELQEGYRRVATTPRLGQPLLPPAVFGEAEPTTPPKSAAERARHPSLPAVTVDFRKRSRAVQAAPTQAQSPASKTSWFPPRPKDGLALGEPQPIDWRQGARRGIPSFPGSFQDVSPRTPDLRTPGAVTGHYHPRRVLIFARPPSGFFGAAPEALPAALSEVAGVLRPPQSMERVTLRSLDLSARTSVVQIEDINVLGEIEAACARRPDPTRRCTKHRRRRRRAAESARLPVWQHPSAWPGRARVLHGAGGHAGNRARRE
jgi:hypothetical protein